MKFYNISASRLNRLKRFLEFTDYKKLYMYLKDKREQVRLYAFEKSGSEDYEYYKYMLERLDKVEFPELVYRKKFLIFLKKKIFEYSNDADEHIFFLEAEVMQSILQKILNVFTELGWDIPDITY